MQSLNGCWHPPVEKEFPLTSCNQLYVKQPLIMLVNCDCTQCTMCTRPTCMATGFACKLAVSGDWVPCIGMAPNPLVEVIATGSQDCQYSQPGSLSDCPWRVGRLRRSLDSSLLHTIGVVTVTCLLLRICVTFTRIRLRGDQQAYADGACC